MKVVKVYPSESLPNNRRNSRDGGSLYGSFRPVAILSKCLGYFPVNNVVSGPYTVNYAFSIIFPTMFVVKMVLLVIFDYEYLRKRYSHRDILDIADMLEYFNTIIAPWVQYLFVLVKFKSIVKLFQRFDQYDKNVVFITQSRHHFVRTVLIISVVFVNGLFSTLLYYLLDPNAAKSETDWYEIVGNILNGYIEACTIITPLQALFLCGAARLRFADVNERVEKVIEILCGESSEQSKGGTSVDITTDYAKKVILKLYSSYTELHDIFLGVSDAYGFTLAHFYFFLILEIVTNLSRVLLVLNGNDTLLEAMSRIVSLLVFTLLMDLECREATRVVPQLRRVALMAPSPGIRDQMKRFAQTMEEQPVQMVAAGFFHINRSLLTAVLGAVCTYLVVIAQFQIAEKQCGG